MLLGRQSKVQTSTSSRVTTSTSWRHAGPETNSLRDVATNLKASVELRDRFAQAASAVPTCAVSDAAKSSPRMGPSSRPRRSHRGVDWRQEGLVLSIEDRSRYPSRKFRSDQ